MHQGVYHTRCQAEYHFTEGPAYLRANGVLDESDPEDPKVRNRETKAGNKEHCSLWHIVAHKDMEWMMFGKSMIERFYL